MKFDLSYRPGRYVGGEFEAMNDNSTAEITNQAKMCGKPSNSSQPMMPVEDTPLIEENLNTSDNNSSESSELYKNSAYQIMM